MAADGPRAQSVQLGDLTLHYTEWGDPAKPPMVLLHGFMAHARTWDLFARDLASDYRILALDQRGHGDTGAAPGDSYTTDDYVGDVERFAAALGVSRFVLVGMSMGGRNSIVYTAGTRRPWRSWSSWTSGPRPRRGARRVPTRPRTPASSTTQARWPTSCAARTPIRPRTTRQEVARHSVRQRPDGRYEWKWAQGLLTGRRGGWDTWEDWRSIHCPVLVVRGAESPVLPRTWPSAWSLGTERPTRRRAALGASGAGGQRPGADRRGAGVPCPGSQFPAYT